eukprot:GFUD01054075.1.p1 GENE.GFUD01054075.1~~GFUD01054075.1.p1  ORF type:complete len:404 (-),score=138.47 GFUD01054075.1:274-1485(-)
MALRNRAFSTNSVENQLGNPLQGKRGLNAGSGTSNLQRAALGDIKNVATARHNSVSTDEPSKEFKQPLNPAVTRRNSKEKENAGLQLPKNEVQIDAVEVMDISSQAVEENIEMQDDSVEDIDADDAGNPQLVVEYVNDIYGYLRHLETVQYVKADYLAGQTELLPKMRAVLIDWLVGVHLQFHLLQETLYTTVAILDRFLQVEVGAVSRNKLQLVGVAAMLVAAKYEEIYAPEVKDFVYITDRAYTEKDILRMEIRILSSLKFDLGRPLPLHFLRRASKAGGVEATTHCLAKYIIELSLGMYNLADLPPSKLSAAALALAMRMLDPASSLESVWSSSLVHYTKYTLEEMRPTIGRLANILISAPTAKLATVYQKYSNKKLMKIARIPVLEDPALKQIAKGERL